MSASGDINTVPCPSQFTSGSISLDPVIQPDTQQARTSTTWFLLNLWILQVPRPELKATSKIPLGQTVSRSLPRGRYVRLLSTTLPTTGLDYRVKDTSPNDSLAEACSKFNNPWYVTRASVF